MQTRLIDLRRMVQKALEPSDNSPVRYSIKHGAILKEVKERNGSTSEYICDLPMKISDSEVNNATIKEIIKQIDRMITQYGKNKKLWEIMKEQKQKQKQNVQGKKETVSLEREEGENRKKDTSEVGEFTSGVSNEIHGGDGNSGEVDHHAETSSQEARNGQTGGKEGNHDSPSSRSNRGSLGEDCNGVSQDTSTMEEPASSGEEGQRNSGSANSRVNVTACSGSANAKGEPTAECTGEPDCGANNPVVEDSEAPETEAPEGAEESSKAVDQPDRDGQDGQHHGEPSETTTKSDLSSPVDGRQTGDPSNEGNSSVDRAPGYGGVYASEEDARPRARDLSKDAREVFRILRRLVRASTVGIGEELSPRISSKKLIIELITRSYRFSRIRREELELAHIVLAPDLSGSCSACAKDTLAAALAIEREMAPAVKVIKHSNGIVFDDKDNNNNNKKLHEILPDNTKLVIVWGDWDGVESYKIICENNINLIWLDCYGKIGGVRKSSEIKKSYIKKWKRIPIKIDGVGTARDTAVALRIAERSMRRMT